MRFLVTRPQPECKRTADKLRAAGHVADEVPLLELRVSAPARFPLPDVSALAVTSRRAVSVLESHPQIAELRSLPVFCVGKATADACRMAGFQQIRSADGDIKALARLILESKSEFGSGVLLYPAAKDRAGDLEGMLAGEGLSCRTVAVYAMEAVSMLPPDIVVALKERHVTRVLVYSKRTAEVLAMLLKANGLEHIFSSLLIYAISQRAAGPLCREAKVHVADAPNEKALLDLVLAEC